MTQQIMQDETGRLVVVDMDARRANGDDLNRLDRSHDDDVFSEDEQGDLMDYHTSEYIRPATADEREASRAAAESDGGAGVILVDEDGNILRADDRGAGDARRCYVQD